MPATSHSQKPGVASSSQTITLPKQDIDIKEDQDFSKRLLSLSSQILNNQYKKNQSVKLAKPLSKGSLIYKNGQGHTRGTTTGKSETTPISGFNSNATLMTLSQTPLSSQVDCGFEDALKKTFEASELYNSTMQSPEQYDPPMKLKIKMIRCKVLVKNGARPMNHHE